MAAVSMTSALLTQPRIPCPHGAGWVLSQSCFFESLGVWKSLNSRDQNLGFCPKIELCDRTHTGARKHRVSDPYVACAARACIPCAPSVRDSYGPVCTGEPVSRYLCPCAHLMAQHSWFCRKFCSGGAEGTDAPVEEEIKRPRRRTVRPQ